jgi:hypothetical protein
MRPLAKFTRVRGLTTYALMGVFSAVLLSCGQPAYRAAAPASALQRRVLSESRLAETPSRVKAQLANFQEAAEVPRRIIYEAEITLVVKDVSAVEAQISALMKELGGYVAESTVDRTQGEELTGRWKVRIPVEHFDTFLNSVSKLGVPENRYQTAQDVTEEFVDLEAQISNKKRLEERIIKLLEDSSGAIKDVIEVERELARVRSEVEQMEGRLRFLINRTELTTVTLVAREVRDYVPPEAPTFANRIRQAWGDSLHALRVFGEQLVVAVVYASPWLAILGAVILPATWFIRKRSATKRRVEGRPME